MEGQLSNSTSYSGADSLSPTLPEHLDPLTEHGGNRNSLEYVYGRIPNSQQTQCYGPTSSYYFMKSMSTHLEKILSSAYSESTSESDIAFISLFCPTDSSSKPSGRRLIRRTQSASQKSLSRWQEEYFLNLFWHSYHCIYPILDETEFKTRHSALWLTPHESRKPSALVDIILALTMQYGTALLPPSLTNATVNAEKKGKDAASDGRFYYSRCQTLLADEFENPSITTLQCHILSAIYLSNVGSHNAAHTTLGLACRVAVILGLHQEPLEDLDENKRNFRRRLWWTLYALEIKASMEYGRPITITLSQITCGLPTDTPQQSSVSVRGSNQSCISDSSFSCNLQFLRLILASRSVYITFYEKCTEIFSKSQQRNLHGSSQPLESCAQFLSSKMQYLRTWLRDVPPTLKMKRRNGNESFSTNLSSLQIEPTVPFILQRQQLFLELHYHTVNMNLLRHFISFKLPSNSPTQRIEANAITCVDHAMTITNIIHQMLTETDLLAGWLESFQWHANAFLSLIGYRLAYPFGQRTTEVRTAIHKAISTFDILSNSLAIATSSAKLAEDLAAKVDVVADRMGADSSTPELSPNPGQNLADVDCYSTESSVLVSPTNSCPLDPSSFSSFEPMTDEMSSSALLDPFDLGGGMEWMGGNGVDVSDMWTIEQDMHMNDPLMLWLGDDMYTRA